MTSYNSLLTSWANQLAYTSRAFQPSPPRKWTRTASASLVGKRSSTAPPCTACGKMISSRSRMKPVYHPLGPSHMTILNHTIVRQSEFTAYTARAKATLPSLPAVSLFHIPLCRTRRWWQASWIGYVSPALLYQASRAPLIMGQTENASCVRRATATTVNSMPRWTRRPPPFVPP